MTDTAPPIRSWEASGNPPRCPKCYYLLEGVSEQGVCPECGAEYSASARFDYARTSRFWPTFLRWTWPGLAGLAVAAVMWAVPDPTCCSVVLVALGLACLVNATVHSFRSLRRKRLRRAAVTMFVPTIGMYAHAAVLGVLVFAATFLVVFGVSCGTVFLMFSMSSGRGH